MRAGIDRGDAEAVADRGVGRRAAPLAEDVLLARAKRDEVVDGQEVRRVVELGDERQLVLERAPDLVRDAVGIALARAAAQVQLLADACIGVSPAGTSSSGYS